MFIGKHEVTKEVYIDDEDGKTRVEIHFDESKDESGSTKRPLTMRKELYDVIKAEVKSEGDVTDRVRHFFCSKFLQELAEYEMDCFMVGVVTRGMDNLILNAQEAAVSKKFECEGYGGMKISAALDV